MKKQQYLKRFHILFLCLLFFQAVNAICVGKRSEKSHQMTVKYKYIRLSFEIIMKVQSKYRQWAAETMLQEIYSFNIGADEMEYKNYLKRWISLLESLNYFHLSNEARRFQCPEDADIYPCSCDNSLEGSTLDCSEASDFRQIKKIIEGAKFPQTGFYRFRYTPSSVSQSQATLPNNLFGPLTFQRIYIENSGLSTISSNGFNGSQSTLEYISLKDNYRFKNFPFNKLDEFTSLEQFYLESGMLKSIESVGHIPKLSRLLIVQNCVLSIAAKAFRNLPAIMLIDLTHNSLKELDDDTLQLNWRTGEVTMALNFNNLGALFPFKGTQPSRLELSDNNITEFTKEVFKPILDALASMDYVEGMGIDITNNPMDCSTMEWVLEYPDYKDYIRTDCDII